MVEIKVATGTDASKERTERNYCPPVKLGIAHHWAIESPNGRTSMGKCTGCGAKRQFSNSTEYIPWNELTSNVGSAASTNASRNMQFEHTRTERRERDIRLSDE